MNTGAQLRCFVAQIALWSALAVHAQVPSLITYQGRLLASGTNYSGTGWFKFALVDGAGTTTYWSNDGLSARGGEPKSPVSLPVNQGLFSVALGDSSEPNMQAIAPSVFTNADVRLRIWFGSLETGFQRLTPDQCLGAVGYAMLSAGVTDNSVTAGKLAPGAVLTPNIAPGAVTTVQLAPSAVTTLSIASSSIISSKLALNAVTAAALADGAVTSNKLAAGAVTAGKLAPGAVTSAAIAPGTLDLANLNFTLGYLNVQNSPYSAKGNGTNDDTAAIQAALNNAGAKGGGIVFLPTGNYYVAGHLSVPAHTTLAGVWRAPTAWSQNKGTTLLAVENAGTTSGIPFITLQGPNSTLEGVTVFYPKQASRNTPIPYPWTVATAGGDNATIQNVLLVNPYLAVDFASHASGRHLIRGLYGQPLLVGIAVDQCYDIGRILDVHFWPFWSVDANLLTFMHSNSVSFDFMRTDWEVVQDIFSLGYAVGARFRASANGSMNGQMSNVNFDDVDIGLQLTATQPFAVHISNLNIANAGGGVNHVGIQALPPASASLNVNGASFWGQIRQVVSWNNPGLLSLSNARLLAWDRSLPAIDIVSGRAMLQANYFQDVIGTAIHVGTNTDRVLILGNELVGNALSLQGPRTYSANNHL